MLMNYQKRMQRIIETDELFKASKIIRNAFLISNERSMKRALLKRLELNYNK